MRNIFLSIVAVVILGCVSPPPYPVLEISYNHNWIGVDWEALISSDGSYRLELRRSPSADWTCEYTGSFSEYETMNIERQVRQLRTSLHRGPGAQEDGTIVVRSHADIITISLLEDPKRVFRFYGSAGIGPGPGEALVELVHEKLPAALADGHSVSPCR